MLRMIREAAKSNVLVTSLKGFAHETGIATTVSSSRMAELHRLLLTISEAEGRNGLDAEGLAGIERALLDSGQPELIVLYRRLLADVEGEGAKGNEGVSVLRFSRLWRVRERGVALVANWRHFSIGRGSPAETIVRTINRLRLTGESGSEQSLRTEAHSRN